MTREEMMNEVIRKYGFESYIAIKFCEIVEEWVSDFAVEQMFIIAMALGYEVESEEE